MAVGSAIHWLNWHYDDDHDYSDKWKKEEVHYVAKLQEYIALLSETLTDGFLKWPVIWFFFLNSHIFS